MTERGLVFTTEHVPKVLDGSKTVTRRLGGLKKINRDPGSWICHGFVDGSWYFVKVRNTRILTKPNDAKIKCPHGIPGNLMYLKETWATCDEWTYPHPGYAWYKATEEKLDAFPWRWRSPRFMSKNMARPWRWELVSVRPERVQDITAADVEAEGIPFAEFCPGIVSPKLSEEKLRALIEKTAKAVYGRLWDSINAARGYAFERNNWVWRIEWNPNPVVGA